MTASHTRPAPAGAAIRLAELGDDAGVEALMTHVFGVNRPPAYRAWMLRDTPAGPGISVVALADGQVVAHAALIHRAMTVCGQTLSCGQSVDAVTHPLWQRRGLNRALSAELDAQMNARAFSVLFGFSNRNSTRGATTYQGRKELGAFPLLVRPLVSRHWLRAQSAVAPAPAVEVPPDLDALWASTVGPRTVSVARTAAALSWRLAKPRGEYRAIALRRGGALTGFGALGVRRYFGRTVAFVMESVALDQEPRAAREVLDALLQTARERGAVALAALAFPGTSEFSGLCSARFVPIPAWANPEDISFSVRGAPSFAGKEWLNRAHWQLRFGEHDVL
jgi:hypothetical protein